MCIYHLQTRCRNSHVLVYHGPLHVATFWKWRSPSTFTMVWIFLIITAHDKQTYTQMTYVNQSPKKSARLGFLSSNMRSLTPLGHRARRLPLAPHRAKLALLGMAFGAEVQEVSVGSGVGHGGQPQSHQYISRVKNIPPKKIGTILFSEMSSSNRQFLGGYVIC